MTEEALVELLSLSAMLEVKSIYGASPAPAHRRAIDVLQRIETIYRPIPAAYRWIAQSWQALGEQKLAQAAAQRAEALSPNTALDYFVLAEFQRYHQGIYQGQFEQALDSYSQVLHRKPDHFLSLLASGGCLWELGRYELAEAMLTGAIAVNPRTSMAYNLRGLCRREQGKVDLALADFSKIAEIDPNDHVAYYSQGWLLNGKGDFAQAIAMFDKALQLNPNSFGSNQGRGKSYARLGQHENAITDFTVVIGVVSPGLKKKPVSKSWMRHLINAYLDRGVAHLKLGRYRNAMADADRALDLPAEAINKSDYYNASCIYSLASALVANDQTEPERETLALQYADRAVELLRQAIEKGYKDLDHMRKDTDLDAIREHPDFRELLNEAETEKETTNQDNSNN